MPFADLQQWLQLTYEVETKYFEERRISAEKQLINAKDMVNRTQYVVVLVLCHSYATLLLWWSGLRNPSMELYVVK